ncbi:sensor domain-containing diguanylate cyclase, partial [Muribaculaceae bacterium Isolate-001 (NCI)]
VVGQACYRVLQGRDEPCPFCTNHLLVREFFHVWEHTNPITGRHYLLKDKLVDWRGKTVRMEVAVDITDKENTSRAIKDKLEMQRALVDCVRTFYTAPTFNEAINIILRILRRIHQADRAYVFEYTSGERDEVFCSNT